MTVKEENLPSLQQSCATTRVPPSTTNVRAQEISSAEWIAWPTHLLQNGPRLRKYAKIRNLRKELEKD